jgi:hypothetical protein
MATAEAEIRAVDATVAWVHDALGLTYNQIGELLEVSERTLRRWRRHEHRPRGLQQEILEDLRELKHLLEEAFPTPRQRDEWLHASTSLLRGRTPISFLRTGRVTLIIDALATVEARALN